jgi:dTDP-4-amino-4,6-dideoxygalactose transaminase
MPATNAKLSEYHAAVGLAALDEWADVRNGWMAIARAYRMALPEGNRLRFQDGFGQSWVTSTCVVRLADSQAAEAEKELAQAGIETRRWWGDGAHAHPATATFPRTLLPATKAVADSTIALPFFRDLGIKEIQRIVANILNSSSDP